MWIGLKRDYSDLPVNASHPHSGDIYGDTQPGVDTDLFSKRLAPERHSTLPVGHSCPKPPTHYPTYPSEWAALSSDETFQFFTSWPPSTLLSALSFSISSSSAREDPCCHAASVPPEPASEAEGTFCGMRECTVKLKGLRSEQGSQTLKTDMRGVGTGWVAFTTMQYGHSCWVSVELETVLSVLLNSFSYSNSNLMHALQPYACPPG